MENKEIIITIRYVLSSLLIYLYYFLCSNFLFLDGKYLSSYQKSDNVVIIVIYCYVNYVLFMIRLLSDKQRNAITERHRKHKHNRLS